MSNQLVGPQSSADRTTTYSWVHVDDFSPGIFDASYISTAEPIISAPIGAASAKGTFACASITGGALAPLPALTQQVAYPVSFPGAVIIYVTGFAVNLSLDDGTTELVIIMEADNGTDHYNYAYSVIASTGGHNVIGDATETSPSTPGVFGAAFPSWTRMSLQPVEGTSGYVVPSPVLVWPGAVATDANGGYGHVYVYPNPADPSVFATGDLVTPTETGVAGPIFCYGNRVLVFQPAGYGWPAGGGIVTNEQIGFTDPPQGTVYPLNLGTDTPNDTILAAEVPWGYGAWGSVSVGEAIFIKRNGGAVVLNGDIENPNSVISLPGVQSVGDTNGLAVATSIGLIYCSQNQGAWVWNGGNVSQKISAQISDNFFDVKYDGISIPDNGYGFLCERWQDWVIFSNNYLFNPDTNSWWILYPNQSQTSSETTPLNFYWWKQGRAGNEMYAAPLTMASNTGDHFWYNKFDNTVASSHWQWQSLPIHVVPTAEQVLDVRQLILRLSCPDAGSALTVTIGTWSGTTTGAIGTSPSIFRFNVGTGALGVDDIVVTLNGDNSTSGKSAPIVHSMDIGFEPRALKGTEN